jgi:hypothetical protein
MTQVSFILFDHSTRAPVLSWPAKSASKRHLDLAERAARAHCETVNGKAGREVTYVRRCEA